MDICRCLWDVYTIDFVDHYEKETGGITGVVALLELALCIIMGRSNTARIESVNALLRRIIGARYQSRAIDIIDLISKFTLCRGRIRESRLLNANPKLEDARKKKRRKTYKTRKKLQKHSKHFKQKEAARAVALRI